jgi:hypothetical protein
MRRSTSSAVVLAVILLVLPPIANAKVGQARTAGFNYDRNASVVQDGALTYLFFARSIVPCNRLAGCNPDVLKYDLYYEVSPDGGKTYGPPQVAATNVETANPIFYGRTIAAVRSVDGTGAGTLYVFWASGGNETTLYYISKAPSASAFTDPAPVLFGALPLQAFNVEAVAVGANVYLYTEECCTLAPGIYSYAFAAGVATGHNLVAANKSIPKAIVDNQGGFRMTMVDATTYPTVDVYVDSSVDGLTWPAPEVLVVHEECVSNWDPNLAQLPNGRYYLHFAPDRTFAESPTGCDETTNENDVGRQRIAVTTSNDFVRWSAPRDVSPAFKADEQYWDYWPEGFVLGNKLTLYYTSERDFDVYPRGTGHIWTVPGLGGLDQEKLSNGSFETSTSGSSPDGWSSAGNTAYVRGGTVGAWSVTTGPLGSWVSAPIAVDGGRLYGVAADVTGSGTVVVEQLSATGTVVGALTQTLSAANVPVFETLDSVVAVGDGVSTIRIRLEGSLLGGAAFDDVHVWEQ